MDEMLICSDFCEERGFTRQAQVLRTLAGEPSHSYIVVERGFEYNDEIDAATDSGSPRVVYLSREAAEREARIRSGRFFQGSSPFRYCYDLSEISPHSPAELASRLARIMGGTGELIAIDEEPEDDEAPMIAADLTPDQLAQVADLFTLKPYYVVEVDLGTSRPNVSESGRE